MSWRSVLVLVALAAALPARAEVSVRARLDRPRVTVGEAADLSIEVQGTQNTAAPTVPAPDGLILRYAGPSTQISIINGQMSAAVTHHFSVTPQRPGTFTIGPLSVRSEERRGGTERRRSRAM